MYNTLTSEINLNDQIIFISGSFPYKERSSRFFESANPMLITDCIIAFCKEIFSKNGRLVFGGHPTFTPLINSVAKDYFSKGSSKSEKILVYQSYWFEDQFIKQIGELEKESYAKIVYTDKKNNLDDSLSLMREKMIKENNPIAGIFIGGMDGVEKEFAFFKKSFPNRLVYPIGTTGGASKILLDDNKTKKSFELTIREEKSIFQFLDEEKSYPFLAKIIIKDIFDHINKKY